MNNISIIGNITKEIELRSTTNGKSVVEVSIAVNGTGENDTIFIPVVVWEKQAENLAKYCTKGSKIAISGKLIQSTYTNQEGKNIRTTKIQANQVMFLSKKEQTDELKDFDNNIKDDEELFDLPF